MIRSALIDRLERHLELLPAERETLLRVEARERRVPSGKRLTNEGKPNEWLYVVQQGWLHGARSLPGGGRQILEFHYPGDLIGTPNIAWANASTTLTAVSDCIVAELTKTDVGMLFDTHPRLAALLYAMAAAENVALSDRLISIGRMNAVGRLSTLLLDMLARLRMTAGGVVSSFDLPLTQTDLGDAVGLTKVHVSRTLGILERDGLIERNGKRMRIVDEGRMIELTGFVDRYKTIDTSWLPPSHRVAA